MVTREQFESAVSAFDMSYEEARKVMGYPASLRHQHRLDQTEIKRLQARVEELESKLNR